MIPQENAPTDQKKDKKQIIAATREIPAKTLGKKNNSVENPKKMSWLQLINRGWKGAGVEGAETGGVARACVLGCSWVGGKKLMNWTWEGREMVFGRETACASLKQEKEGAQHTLKRRRLSRRGKDAKGTVRKC